MAKECLIRLEHVGNRFDGQVVHDDINLCVFRGDILGLVGGSGSGKTTLMRTMIGLQKPVSGRAWMFDRPLDRISGSERLTLAHQSGVLFQAGALFSALNVFDNIAFPLRESGFVAEPLVRRLVCLKLAMVGLPASAATRLPAELSGGMVKRAALARALALEPELLFLDEPTSGLDPIASQEFVQLVSDLHGELGLTVVMVTHDLDLMHDLCSRITALADGRIVADGTPEDIRESTHPFVHSFFHGRRANRVFAAGEAN
jgi:phospholipid/cholesterol/gamma-HCH transport system ATP-binding protein